MVVQNYFVKRISSVTQCFCNYFLAVIKEFENANALIDTESDGSVSYLELIDRTVQMRNALLRLGIQHGDRIGTYAGNSVDYIIFVLAASGTGAVLIPLNPAYKPYEIEKCFNEAGVSWILTEHNLFEKIRKVSLRTIRATIVLDSAEETSKYFGIQAFLTGESKYQRICSFQEDPVSKYDPAIIFFSSGTTGPPKGIVLSNQALIANGELVRNAVGAKCGKYEMARLSDADVVYGVLPYFHAGGLLSIFGLLGLGLRIIVNRKFNGQQFLRTLIRYKVTTALLVPPILKFLADNTVFVPKAFCSLKYIFVGSASVQKELIELVKLRLPTANIIQYSRASMDFLLQYMAQRKPVHLFSCSRYIRKQKSEVAEFCCRALNARQHFNMISAECKIMDQEGNKEYGSMQTGEIWLRTATMMCGYLGEAAKAEHSFADGWFRTGDLGYYDFQNFMYITGRTKEMIKVRGWQVSPYEIEEAIQALPEVELCAVVGIPDENSGQLPKAYIQLRDGAQLDENSIHQLVNSKFASYKQLKGGVQFIKCLPLTGTGKIARTELVNMSCTGNNKSCG